VRCWLHFDNVASNATTRKHFVCENGNGRKFMSGVKVAKLVGDALLGQWVKDALDHWEARERPDGRKVSQSRLAAEMTKALARSIDRAAVNKMMKGPRRTGGRDLAADEMLAISQITGYPLPGVEAIAPKTSQSETEFRPFTKPQLERLSKILSFLLPFVAQTPSLAESLNDPAHVEGLVEVILRAAQARLISAVDMSDDEAALVQVELALQSWTHQ
jgi:hypothetical protein